MSRTITMTLPVERRQLRKMRPARVREYGRRLHPQSVTDAWYAADCPPNDGFRGRRLGVSRGDWLRWRVACLLRGC